CPGLTLEKLSQGDFLDNRELALHVWDACKVLGITVDKMKKVAFYAIQPHYLEDKLQAIESSNTWMARYLPRQMTALTKITISYPYGMTEAEEKDLNTIMTLFRIDRPYFRCKSGLYEFGQLLLMLTEIKNRLCEEIENRKRYAASVRNVVLGMG